MSSVEQADARTVKAWLDNDKAVMVDVREDDEVAAAYIPGTVHIPMSRFDPALIPDPGGRRLVFQCAAGTRSNQVAQYLAMNGIVENPVNLIGGIQAWAADGLPITR